jgi:TPR repeat protein
MPADFEKAYDCFTEAAAGGIAQAHYHLGSMHEHAQSVPLTYAESAYHYRLAALENDVLAADRLIDFYLTGKGVDRDLAMAEFWLRRLVTAGNNYALPQLADVLIERENHVEAFEIYKKLSTMKDNALSGFGFWGLSECYLKGLGVESDEILGDGYRQIAVQKGNPDALNELANAYIAREKTKEGLETMTRAAKGSADASYSLGQMYFFGTNVEKDRAKSFDLLRESARMRNPKAMYFLAAASYNHEPDAPGIDEAIRFAEMAENMGVPDATNLREKLERRRDKTDEDQEQVARARSG